MSDDRIKKCTRCGIDVPRVLSGPIEDRNVWTRYRAGLKRTTSTNTLKFSMFRREWLPENPHDQLRETFTTLELCDDCTRLVFLFAQGEEAPR